MVHMFERKEWYIKVSGKSYGRKVTELWRASSPWWCGRKQKLKYAGRRYALKVFADSTRIKILYALSEGELCVCDIWQSLGLTQSAVSHQLRILKQMRLVKYRKEGKTIYYSLDDGHIQSILNQGLEHIME